jgi:hypothetical protein
MTACTVAAIVSMLGSMPPRGTVITVPRSAVAQYSVAQQITARICAKRYGIQWRIDEDR